MHATAFKLTYFQKKCHFYANKRSGSVRIQEKYSLGGKFCLSCTTRAFFHGCQIVHQDLLNAKESSPKQTVWDM